MSIVASFLFVPAYLLGFMGKSVWWVITEYWWVLVIGYTYLWVRHMRL